MADEKTGDKVVQMTAPNGIQVSVAESKVEARRANGYTLLGAAKKAAAKKATPKKQTAKKAAASKSADKPADPAE